MRRCNVADEGKEVIPENNAPKPEPLEDLSAPSASNPSLDEPENSPQLGVPHPLAPGGRRFEQVYAQGKQAQRDAQELRERLVAAEAKIELLSGKSTADDTADKEYSWAELETFIQQGRITRADANAHREEVTAKKLEARIKNNFVTETRQATREQTLVQTVQDYLTAVPNAKIEGTPERIRLEEEYEWLASVQGVDLTKVSGAQRAALQVSAFRNVYGSLDSFKQRGNTRTETSQGISGGSAPSTKKANPDQQLLDALTPVQVEHYRKMMRTGRYAGGWKDVVEELKYVPPVRRSL